MLAEDRYFGTSLYLFLMNQERYDALPTELRAVIDNNSGMSLAKQAGHIWLEEEKKQSRQPVRLVILSMYSITRSASSQRTL